MPIEIAKMIILLLFFGSAFARIDVNKPAQTLAVHVYSPTAELNLEQCNNIAEDILNEFMQIDTYLYFENSKLTEEVKKEIELCDSYFTLLSNHDNIVSKDRCIKGLADVSPLPDKLVIAKVDSGYIGSRFIDNKTGLNINFSAIQANWLSDSEYKNPKENLMSNFDVINIAEDLHSNSDKAMDNRSKYFNLNNSESILESKKISNNNQLPSQNLTNDKKFIIQRLIISMLLFHLFLFYSV